MRARVISALLLLAPACSGPPRPTISIDGDSIKTHIQKLASDEMQGRAPGGKGEELATTYISDFFKSIGLQTQLQPVPMVGLTTTAPRLELTGKRGKTTLKYGDDFVAWSKQEKDHVSANGELVFCGYGVVAPEYEWNDFKTDVKGKIIVVLINDPQLADQTKFGGKAITYYGRWTYKLEEAARQGAAGALIVHTTESATYPWDVVRGSWSVEQFMLDRVRTPSLAFAGWVQHDVAQRALAQLRLDLDSLTHAAARRDFRPVSTGIHAAVEITSALRHVESDNVVAKLPGHDLRLGREAVLFTAHWDHKGIGPATNGDSIYNGAEDNASGVAAMLAAAQALVEVTPHPRRTVLFIATTAEESGLLGSEAYVQAPLVPLDRTAAVLNIDVANVRGATRDIDALGIERSTLGDAFRAAARAESLAGRHLPDVRGSFYRSDHFPSARAGVPALSFKSGLDFVDRPEGWGKEQEDEYNGHRYHQPSDEYAPGFRYDGTAQQVRVALRVALAVANAPQPPRWLPSSEFQRQR